MRTVSKKPRKTALRSKLADTEQELHECNARIQFLEDRLVDARNERDHATDQLSQRPRAGYRPTVQVRSIELIEVSIELPLPDCEGPQEPLYIRQYWSPLGRLVAVHDPSPAKDGAKGTAVSGELPETNWRIHHPDAGDKLFGEFMTGRPVGGAGSVKAGDGGGRGGGSEPTLKVLTHAKGRPKGSKDKHQRRAVNAMVKSLNDPKGSMLRPKPKRRGSRPGFLRNATGKPVYPGDRGYTALAKKRALLAAGG